MAPLGIVEVILSDTDTGLSTYSSYLSYNGSNIVTTTIFVALILLQCYRTYNYKLRWRNSTKRVEPGVDLVNAELFVM